MITIRRALAEETEAVVTLRLEFISDYGNYDASSDAALVEATRLYVERTLPSGDLRMWFAERDGQVVATGAMIFFDRMPTIPNRIGKEAYFLSIYTRPASRQVGGALTTVGCCTPSGALQDESSGEASFCVRQGIIITRFRSVPCCDMRSRKVFVDSHARDDVQKCAISMWQPQHCRDGGPPHRSFSSHSSHQWPK